MKRRSWPQSGQGKPHLALRDVLHVSPRWPGSDIGLHPARLPRIQIKGAAGLGKTQAVIAEYVKRPALWRRHITVNVLTLALADDFVAAVTLAAADVPPAPDGGRPLPIVIYGRGEELCDPERLKLTNAAKSAGCDLVYRACCHTPAVGNAPESSARLGHGAKCKDTSHNSSTMRRHCGCCHMHASLCGSRTISSCQRLTWLWWTNPQSTC